MPFEKTYEGEPKVSTPPCVYLRNKAMYVRGTVGDAENYPDETGAGYCWCNMTQHVPERDCYRETY
jgi:hypothetical protein